MAKERVEIRLWATECQFCNQQFAKKDKGKVAQALIDHIDNGCQVLKCLCIIKDIPYPLR